MDHEGPRPSLKHQKRSTAAEQITNLHEEYEARGKPSSDRLLSVVTHNETYPKLRKEISNRRSVANVSDVGKAQLHSSRSTSRAGQRKRKRRGKNLTRVNKKRSHKANCTNLRNKIFGTKSCQFSNRIWVINRRIGTEADETVAPTVVVSETNFEPKPPSETKRPSSSVGSIGSRITSVSSLNSYYSMDQEPMGRSR